MKRTLSMLALPAALLAAAPGVAAQRQVTVRAATVASLDAKLQAFSRGLSAPEQAAWTALLRQAAGAPADDASGTQVRPALYRAGGGGGAIVLQSGPQGIIVQGGRANVSPRIIVQGGAPRTGGGAVAIGPKPDDPRAPGGVGNGAVAIGPKQDDPAHGLAIGPKQDDPAAALAVKLRGFAESLNPDEQAAFDWFLQRAAANPRAGGGGAAPTFAQSLGVTPLRPPPGEDPHAAPANLAVTLRF